MKTEREHVADSVLGNQRHESGPRGTTGDRHRDAVVSAEVKRLVHALDPYRVLHRSALEREAKAQRWHEAGFEQALQAAVRQGQIEPLPFGFYRLPHGEQFSRPPSRDR
ncbi:MAG: hypothetical protein ACLPTJ_00930 [Solirubrobacteraceae bacterium]